MALEIKTIQQVAAFIIDSLIQAVNNNEPDTTKHIDPSIRNSLIRGLVLALTAGIDDINRNIRKVEKEIFPENAGEQGLLIDWGVLFGINRNQPFKANGKIIFSGTVGGIIPISTLLQRANNIQYTTLSQVTITQQTINVLSITRSGSTATLTTVDDHNLATGFVIDSIQGADQTEYNVTNSTITATGNRTLTYTVSGTPVSPATGTITLTFTGASVNVNAVEEGADGNADSGTQLTLISPLVDVDNTSLVTFDGLVGGLDIETIEALRARIQERTSNLVNVFAAKGLEAFIKEEIDGATRVFVQDSFAPTKTVSLTSLTTDSAGVATADPALPITDFINGSFVTITGANEPDLNIVKNAAFQRVDGKIVFSIDIASSITGTGSISISYSTVPPGRVVIYPLFDNQVNIIPSGQQVNDVKNVIIDPDNEVKPANTPDEFVIVKSAIAVPVAITFTSLSPNTTDMRDAISANLDGFFRNDTVLGQDMSLEQINNIIFTTTDSNGNTPIFELSLPSGDTAIDDGEIGTLGTVTFP